MADWTDVVALLSSQADVAAVDLPGFGLSPTPGSQQARFALHELAQDVLAVSDALAWEKPILIGHSHGAGIALALAATYPQRVAALVLVGSLGWPMHLTYRLLGAPGMISAMRLVGASARVGFLRSILGAAVRRSVTDACFPEHAPADLQQRSLQMICESPHALVSMVQLARGNPSRQVLDAAARVTCPVVFVHGQSDAIVPLAHARNIHRRIVGGGGTSRFHTLPSAGHLVPIFQPAAVAEAVDTALTL
jgi:pyruvate dehydrogenase E2 component (dihydrolipoamide acetyltransferase)